MTILVYIVLSLVLIEGFTLKLYGEHIESPVVCSIKQVDSLFAEWDTSDSPGCALCIIKDGCVVYERGYGSANLEHNISITPHSIFHVASLSKQFTACCILLLEQEGKLSLDDDIRKYLPEVPNFGYPITIRHLLHHTSGLRDQWELFTLAGWRADDVKTEHDVLELVMQQKELNFNPGDEYMYCNTGYTLMALIIQRITGQSLRAFAEEYIFRPLSMNNTHFNDEHAEVVKNRTSAYMVKKDGKRVISIPVYDMAGATCLFTTISDLARWDQNFYHKRVGGEIVINKMHETPALNNGERIDYACGLIHGKYRGLKTIAHTGSDAGYRAYYVRFPEENISVICLCNLNVINPVKLSMQVADILLEDRFVNDDCIYTADVPGFTLSKARQRDKVGIYMNSSMHDIRNVFIDKDKLMIVNPSDELLAVRENCFRGIRSLTEYIFEDQKAVCAEGSDVSLLIEKNLANDHSKSMIFEKIKSIILHPKDIKEFEGKYYSEELDAIYAFVNKEDRILLRRKKHEDVPLLIISENDFYAEGIGYLEFTRDEEGRILEYMLSTSRIRHLRFAKVF